MHVLHIPLFKCITYQKQANNHSKIMSSVKAVPMRFAKTNGNLDLIKTAPYNINKRSSGCTYTVVK